MAYKITMPFPAEELTSFYNKEITRMDFAPLPEEGIGTFQWENFNPKSGKWEVTITFPGQYTATWVDKDKSKRVWLFIGYKYDAMDEKWKVTPFVSCNIAKYFDSSEFKDYSNINYLLKQP